MGKPKIALWQQYLGIGDLIWHIPYMRKLAEHSYNDQIHLITRPSTMPYDVLGGEGCIADIILFDRKPRKSEYRKGKHDGFNGAQAMARTLQAYGLDEIYIFSDRALLAYISKKAGVTKRSGFGFSVMQRLFLNHPPFLKKDPYEGSRIYYDASRLMMAHGFIDAPIVPKMAVDQRVVDQMANKYADLPKPWFGFSIGASNVKKCWAAENFVALANRIIADFDGSVFLLGGPKEQDFAVAIQSKCQYPNNIQPLTDCAVYETAGLLRSINFTIGNDTGALNLSVANDTPALGLFGATLPLKHDPILYGMQAASMALISTDMVFDEFLTLYEKKPNE